MRRTPIRVSAVAITLVVACSPGTASTTSSGIATSTTQQASTTTVPEPATSTVTVPGDQTVQVLLQPFSDMSETWSEVFLPYGEAEDQLGTSPGGDGLMLGPEYGTQTPDGNFWILDVAKQRAAVFTPDGTYLEQVVFPEEVLVDGRYFQYQMPQALDDGSIAVGGLRGENTSALLRIVDGSVSSTTFEGAVSWVTTDGTDLYGLSFEDARPYRLDPDNPPGVEADWLLTRCQTRYSIVVQGDEIAVELPDAAVPMTTTLQLRYSEEPEVIAHAGIEVETGIDGSIFILLYGAPESDETLGIGGLIRISPNGSVGEVASIRNPFSPADPGSPAHLGVTPFTSDPWLMTIDEDGVRIYTRG